jgi:hypothetical protein
MKFPRPFGSQLTGFALTAGRAGQPMGSGDRGSNRNLIPCSGECRSILKLALLLPFHLASLPDLLVILDTHPYLCPGRCPRQASTRSARPCTARWSCSWRTTSARSSSPTSRSASCGGGSVQYEHRGARDKDLSQQLVHGTDQQDSQGMILSPLSAPGSTFGRQRPDDGMEWASQAGAVVVGGGGRSSRRRRCLRSTWT